MDKNFRVSRGLKKLLALASCTPEQRKLLIKTDWAAQQARKTVSRRDRDEK